jgi:hypothetical protein
MRSRTLSIGLRKSYKGASALRIADAATNLAGTPNKSALLKHAAIKAAATDPNLSPPDFLLKLMRQGDLPLELRVTVAQKALTHPN